MFGSVSVRYETLMDDIDKHIDKMAGANGEPSFNGKYIDDVLVIKILVALITVTNLLPSITAVKTVTRMNAI